MIAIAMLIMIGTPFTTLLDHAVVASHSGSSVCGKSASGEASAGPSGFVEITGDGFFEYEARVIPPSSIDPATDLLSDYCHVVAYPTDRPLQDQLFVWLPGTGHRLTNNTYILRIAAYAGFRTIGLSYPNAEHYMDVSLEGDAQGVENFRLEKIYGMDVSDVIDVNRANCIEYRLISLLQWLDSQYPGEGWGEYVDEQGIVWGDIVLAGFSQGASTVGVISRDNEVTRAVLIGSGGAYTVVDQENETIELSPFEDVDRATPADRTYGLLHRRDGFARKSFTFRELGLDEFGDFVRADLESPPYDGTHILSTDHIPRNDSNAFHNSLASDIYMPLNQQGIPLLAEDYYYLFTSGL